MVLGPYRDSQGRLTIGVGRCLDTKGISSEEALFMLDRDIADAVKDARRFGWFTELAPARQDTVVAMIFNLGFLGFHKFEKLIAALKCHDYEKASMEMLASRWREQVGKRAFELATMMRTGRYADE